MLEKQMERERRSIDMRRVQYTRTVEHQGLAESKPAQRLLRDLVGPVSAAIGEWVYGGTNQARRHATVAGSLAAIGADPDALAVLALRAALKASQKGTEPMSTTSVGLGRWVGEHLAWVAGDADPEHRAYLRTVAESLKAKSNERHRRNVARHVARKRGVDLGWDDTMCARVGRALLELMLKSTAHFEAVEYKSARRRKSVLRMSQQLLDWLMESHELEILLRPLHLPMCLEPMPWTDPYDGGYLSLDLGLTKAKSAVQRRFMHERMQLSSDLVQVYKALNKVQRTPWRINARLVATVRALWAREGDHPCLPAKDDFTVPAKPWGEDEKPDFKGNDVHLAWKRAAKEVHDANAALRSQRLDLLQKLDVADVCREDERFWFVYNLDWRGRMYPQGALTPQSDDVGRSMLEFADGKPMGADGGFWLGVHLSNSYGFDKAPLAKRFQWAMEHSADIRASAEDPLAHDWWTKADEPWQTLAACFEFAGWLEHGDDWVTHLPVAMDGSANGLQHYAALLADRASAEAVNLTKRLEPADIYQRVADRVRQILTSDDSLTTEDSLAYWLMYDGDWRGLVKRPVMTVPYAVTRYGMRQQIADELRKRHGPSTAHMEHALFLAPIVEQAIHDTVSAASGVMAWLQECVTVVNEAGDDAMWTTPVGLPVRQVYRRAVSDNVQVYIGGVRKQVRLSNETNVPNGGKAVAAIAPNYIHSMDAAHLMATVNAFDGTALAMVHDSYGTLACDAGLLARTLRETFAAMYQVDHLRRLYDELVELGYEVPEPPARVGDWDPAEVLEADYFFA